MMPAQSSHIRMGLIRNRPEKGLTNEPFLTYNVMLINNLCIYQFLEKSSNYTLGQMDAIC